MQEGNGNTPKVQETQGQFRARMRTAFGDGRNGTIHWRDNPAAQAEIAARKALKDQAWQAQLATWKQARTEKKAVRNAEQELRMSRTSENILNGSAGLPPSPSIVFS